MKAEERLADTLRTLAQQVDAAPDAYERTQGEWKRRDRRRRAVVALLAVLVIAAADGAALWALSTGSPETHIVERWPDDRPPVRVPLQP